MSEVSSVRLRRGRARPSDLSAALDRLGLVHGQDFVVLRAVDVDDPDFELDGRRLGPFRTETSRQAALDNYPRSGSQRHAVLMAIYRGEQQGLGGRTSDEVQAELGLEPQSVTARVWELRKGGWLQNTGRHRRTRLKSKAMVVELTPKGRDAVAARES